jgi:hypothetical protein
MLVLIAAGGAAGGELRDPTRPPRLAPPPTPAPQPAREVEWKLTLIKYSPVNRSAILNGQVVREGDRIARARVVKILRDALTLELDGRRFRVTLHHPAIKRVTGARARRVSSGDD